MLTTPHSIYLHAIISDVFRPVLHKSERPLRLRLFIGAPATSEAIYLASTTQLKRLLLIYRLAFKTATLSVLCQTGFIYVANAMVRETGISDAEWHYYWHLCVAGLEDLYGSFREFGSIIRALLLMALQRGAIGVEEASCVAGELAELGRQHVLVGAQQGGNGELKKSTWIVDLDLAVIDPAAAQGGNLAERFRQLMLKDAFTMSTHS